MKTAITSTFILGSALAAMAHLGTLSEPKAGQTYQVGSTLAVKWTIDADHPGGIDLAYSKANGPWVTIATGLNRTATAQNWTLPESAQGSNIRLRVCQRGTTSRCTDAHNTSQPAGAGGDIYTLVSGNFTISAPTIIRPGSIFDGASLAYRPESRSVEVAFTLATPERVTLEAFDTQGKRLAILMNNQKPNGRHVLSIFSHALNVTTPFILRLQIGDKVLQQALEAR